MFQSNAFNFTVGKNVILSGNNVQGSNFAFGIGNTQIVTGGINSGVIVAL